MRTTLLSLLLCSAASAEITSWSTTFTIDGVTYRKDVATDTESGSTTEALYTLNADGAATFVASLYSDGATSNWTGRIGGTFYADEWNDAVGDWVVIVGAETWPTWTDFSDALTALHFWDDGAYYEPIILIDDAGVIYYDIAVFAFSAESGTFEPVETTPAFPGQVGLMKAMTKASNARARVALMTVLSNPTPHAAFPALAAPGLQKKK